MSFEIRPVDNAENGFEAVVEVGRAVFPRRLRARLTAAVSNAGASRRVVWGVGVELPPPVPGRRQLLHAFGEIIASNFLAGPGDAGLGAQRQP